MERPITSLISLVSLGLMNDVKENDIVVSVSVRRIIQQSSSLFFVSKLPIFECDAAAPREAFDPFSIVAMLVLRPGRYFPLILSVESAVSSIVGTWLSKPFPDFDFPMWFVCGAIPTLRESKL